MVDFTVLVLAGAHASGVAVTLDMLQAAAGLAAGAGTSQPRWRVLAPGGGAMHLSNGMQVGTRALPLRAGGDASTWVVPGLGVSQAAALALRLEQPDAQHAIAALRRHAAHGGRVAASCSSVFLLQAAGLLAQRRATTSWWLAAALRRLEPGCMVDADRMVCVDGRLVTGGAALAQADLMLHLLRVRFGSRLSDTVSRSLLLDARQAQAPFALPALMADGDELVRQLTRRLEAALPAPPRIAALAQAFAMSERTLARRVRAATGRGPLALLQAVRLNRARALIENSRLSIDEVAAQVGYGDATALRRLMHKSAGAAPSRFRSTVSRRPARQRQR